MGKLSNFLRRADATPPAPLSFGPAAQEQVHAALRFVLAANGRPASEEAVLDFLQFSIQRRVKLEDLWVAQRGGRVLWALLPLVSPGRTMLLLSPGGQPRGHGGAEMAETLVESVCQHFGNRGVRMAQVLLDPSDAAGQQIYASRSFDEMAQLLYLQVQIRRPLPAPELPAGSDLLTYDSSSHSMFAATILQSYRDSLDCPSLNGLRDIEDVIAGHKSSGTGQFNPKWWFVLREHGEALAVLLLARAGQPDVTELVYLGLVPQARRRGLGDLLMRQALHVISSENAGGTLALAVDAQNAPALRLYHRHGLRRIGSRLALMRELRPRYGGVSPTEDRDAIDAVPSRRAEPGS